MALTVTMTAQGPSAPAYEDVLSGIQQIFRDIYGSDINLDADTSDGQLCAILASAFNDANAAIVDAYAQFSPTTASGTGLDAVVKVNGIARYIPTWSTVDLRIVGQAGTTITGGIVEDVNGIRWNLPDSVVIPPEGETTVTATCQEQGAITASAGTVTTIITPTLGWQTVSNPSAAVAGSPVETDAQLRARQTISVALPSHSIFDGLLAGVGAVDGVTDFTGVDNDTGSADANGIPGHTVAIIADGGDAQEIAQAIFLKKGIGTGTYGSVTETVTDDYGIAHSISFSRSTPKPVYVKVTLNALPGYETDIGNQIATAVEEYIDSLNIGDDLSYTRLYLPASLCGTDNIQYYRLVSVETSIDGVTYAEADITTAYNEKITSAGVTVTVQ